VTGVQTCALPILDGKIPVVYSITSFAIYRPFELIRNYLNHENIPVKIVGGGRDKEYGYLGFSHWAEEDIDILSNFKNLNLFKPKEFNLKLFNTFMFNNKPSYLNLSK
jgi:transketolase